MKHEHSSNMMIGAALVLFVLGVVAWQKKLPTDEQIEAATPDLSVEATPFNFVCWSGKTEMIRYENVVEAARLLDGDWSITQQGLVERYYRPRGGEYCGVEI